MDPAFEEVKDPLFERRTWLVITLQEGRFRAGMAAVFCGAAVWILSGVAGLLALPDVVGGVLSLIGAAITVSSILFLLLAIRCPACKQRVMAYYLKRSSFNRWLIDLQNATHCPKCGYPEEGGIPEEKHIRVVS